MGEGSWAVPDGVAAAWVGRGWRRAGGDPLTGAGREVALERLGARAH